MNNTTQRPGWWTDTHDSSWSRFKAAIKRDWEQTKADLGGLGSGHDINQDASDTFRQTSGKQPIPDLGTPNPPDAKDIERHAKNAAKAQERAMDAQRDANRSPEVNERRLEKVANAQEVAAKKQAELKKSQQMGWSDIEPAVEYGYVAGLQHGSDWSTDLEPQLRSEWGRLYDDRPWDDVVDHVRLGWTRGQANARQKS